MKKLLSKVMYALAIILSYLMCIVVTYRYCSRMCNIDWWVAKFPRILLIIFIVVIWICVFFGIKFGKTEKICDEKKDEIVVDKK